MNCQKNCFRVRNIHKMSNLAVLLLFANFLKNFLGMISINCQEMDLIALFKMSFPWLERSGLAHCPIIIAIIQ